MKVAVTGGTGFVGCHTVGALLEAGHTVRLLVRDPARMAPALEPLGIQADLEHVTGDVTDSDAVERVLEGCDAVIHSASIYSLDPRRGKEIRATNVASTERVLGSAVRMGLDPIIHVSSVAALLGEKAKRLDRDSEPSTPSGIYGRSKADSDRVARRFQTEGAPVTITYPGQVFGPHDPHWGEGARIIAEALSGGFRMAPAGSVPYCDVRDVARLHVALMEAGRGSRRYVVPVHNCTPAEILAVLNRITGRSLKTSNVPYRLIDLPLRGMNLLQRVVPKRLPLNHETVWVVSRDQELDDTATREELGLQARPLEDTLRDQIRWMLETGRLKPKLAGELATPAAV